MTKNKNRVGKARDSKREVGREKREREEREREERETYFPYLHKELPILVNEI